MFHSVDQTLHQRELCPFKKSFEKSEKYRCLFNNFLKDICLDFLPFETRIYFLLGKQNASRYWPKASLPTVVPTTQDFIGISCL